MTKAELMTWLSAGPDIQVIDHPANYLNFLSNPQLLWQPRFLLLRDMRKGGLNPDMYNAFEQDVIDLVNMGSSRWGFSYLTEKYKLQDISEFEIQAIEKQLRRLAKELAACCWHPEAGTSTCTLDTNGNPKVTNAHSLQENGILSRIAPNGKVTKSNPLTGGFESIAVHKSIASTFKGMCNKHDAVFGPIEKTPYTGSSEQHFLHAYRSFLYSQHIK